MPQGSLPITSQIGIGGKGKGKSVTTIPKSRFYPFQRIGFLHFPFQHKELCAIFFDKSITEFQNLEHFTTEKTNHQTVCLKALCLERLISGWVEKGKGKVSQQSPIPDFSNQSSNGTWNRGKRNPIYGKSFCDSRGLEIPLFSYAQRESSVNSLQDCRLSFQGTSKSRSKLMLFDRVQFNSGNIVF
ncbi:hypothetical protein CDAR_502251 [Caerostris darwini]|uniref:Uncharacterized protein n=1 Tax=Caerostris darwini TaxID=1538125 RepID=A0AAV4R4L0_9ARAC|nr:hypothetical protein CDAR_502251 [Caerostris darwini]